ncbi:MAG TPA: hypothetical protein DDY14_02250 [Chromatiaceae bacterium]|jgi:hypothetical protein|nr:MAG: hypothetical protein N838_01420 [Thiohalocapsa sp. PB-PSB1]HBG94153.1 hypothetical protein [Chromatiaceae bacterium]HCS89935.1 hypothetical protein [Chromatiaceae bacterium]
MNNEDAQSNADLPSLEKSSSMPVDNQDPAMAAAETGVDAKMAQLRQLLFGSQLREYDRRLQELSERQSLESARLRDEQRVRFDKLDAFVRGELERLSGTLHRQREERVTATRQLTERIETLAAELARDFGERIDSLDVALTSECSQRQAAMLALSAEQSDALESRARALEEQLFAERDRLQDAKTNRDELAQLFSELALRLNRELDLP